MKFDYSDSNIKIQTTFSDEEDPANKLVDSAIQLYNSFNFDQDNESYLAYFFIDKTVIPLLPENQRNNLFNYIDGKRITLTIFQKDHDRFIGKNDILSISQNGKKITYNGTMHLDQIDRFTIEDIHYLYTHDFSEHYPGDPKGILPKYYSISMRNSAYLRGKPLIEFIFTSQTDAKYNKLFLATKSFILSGKLKYFPEDNQVYCIVE